MYPEAVQAFEQAHAAAPENADAAIGLAAASVGAGDAARALDAYRAVRRRGNPAPEVAFNVGLVLQESGDHNAAAECYRDAVSARPNFTEALVNLGHALESRGESEQAKVYWGRALELSPELAAEYLS
jgi:tetratricopeptide (TPR) repeat protein